jgi:hypothetical protein
MTVGSCNYKLTILSASWYRYSSVCFNRFSTAKSEQREEYNWVALCFWINESLSARTWIQTHKTLLSINKLFGLWRSTLIKLDGSCPGRSQIKNTVHKVQQSVSAAPVAVPTCTLYTQRWFSTWGRWTTCSSRKEKLVSFIENYNRSVSIQSTQTQYPCTIRSFVITFIRYVSVFHSTIIK